MIVIITAVLFLIATAYIILYALLRLDLALKYIRLQSIRKRGGDLPPEWTGNLPAVTVQLPIYNEMYVVEHLIDAVSKFDYPPERLQIQVLDDSTDETVDIVARQVAALHRRGVNITHIRRPERIGFKAGALQHGLQSASGEFIAIFDADFVPDADFLKKTLGYFASPRVGAVQTRWTFLNRNYSFLTKVYAFAMDMHFTVEQGGREYGGYFMNFSGSGGVLRREMIEDAGGWSADTLIEDVDLSFRAQLRGWKFRFEDRIGTPSEVPAAASEIKNQQFRWTKGIAEACNKHLWSVLTAQLPFMTKLHAVIHLSGAYLFVFNQLVALLLTPIILFSAGGDKLAKLIYTLAPINLVSLFLLMFVFSVTPRFEGGRRGFVGMLDFMWTYAGLFAISTALCINNSIAAMEGLMGIKTPFIRTAKLNIKHSGDDWRTRRKYLKQPISPILILETAVALYFAASVGVDIYLAEYPPLALHLLYAAGYGAICFYSYRQHLAFAFAPAPELHTTVDQTIDQFREEETIPIRNKGIAE